MNLRFTNKNLLINSVGALIIFIGVLYFLMLAALALCNHLSGDDYVFLNWQKTYGFWGFQKHFYTAWSGRYFINFIFACFSYNQFIISNYWLHTLVILGGTVLSIYLFYNQLLISICGYKGNTPKIFLITSIVFINLLLSNLDINETYFWLSSITNQLTVIVYILFVVSGLKLFASEGNKKKFWFCLLILLIIIINGSSEIAALAIGNLLLLFAYYSKKLIFSKAFLSLLLIFSLTALLNFFSKGNAVRMDGLEPRGWYISTVHLFYNFIQIIEACIRTPFFICSIPVVYFLGCSITVKNSNLTNFILSKASIKNVCKAIALFIVTVLTPIMLLVGGLPERTLNFVIQLLQFFALCSSFLIGVKHTKSSVIYCFIENQKSLKLIIVVSFYCFSIFNPFVKSLVINVLSSKVFIKANANRDDFLKTNSKKAFVALPNFQSFTDSIVNNEHSNLPNKLKNILKTPPSFLFRMDELVMGYDVKAIKNYYEIDTLVGK